jgi:cytochrome c
LFWGDVGQNTIDNPARGPISYDEWHVATEAGFFGWPYFAGPNAPYSDFDFETEEIGPFFQVDHPVNASVNNTGRKDLPPAKSALIWYSYDESKEFEHLGTGGKSPIAGPVFYADRYNDGIRTENSIALPNHYDGKLFIAEWLRDWVNVVSLTPEAKVEKIEPFMRNTTFSHPIELELGPEGALYVLDYGPNWFSKNKEAALYRIGYVRGNRPPVVKLGADKLVGATPLTVKFSSDGTFDPDSGSSLKYEWYFDKDEVQSQETHPTHTFTEKGIYTIKVVVTDEKGKATTVTEEVRVGNDMPVVHVSINGNRSFYWDNKPIEYKVQVDDKEDGSLGKGTISANDVAVNLTYSTMGTDLTLVEQSEDVFTSSATGWKLMQDSDCKACHSINAKSVGPTYVDIASRYTNEKANIEKLASKIISGGSGVWGENVMSAHPQLSVEQAQEMVTFILSLKDDAQATRPLPPAGSFVPDAHVKDKSAGDYILTVSYKDKVVNGIGPNTVRERIIFRHPEVNALASSAQEGVSTSGSAIAFTKDQSWILFKDIDLTGIRSITFIASAHQNGGTLTVRAEEPNGNELARINVSRNKAAKRLRAEAPLPWKGNRSPLKQTKGKHDVYIVFEEAADYPASDSTAFFLKSVRFDP